MRTTHGMVTGLDVMASATDRCWHSLAWCRSRGSGGMKGKAERAMLTSYSPVQRASATSCEEVQGAMDGACIRLSAFESKNLVGLRAQGGAGWMAGTPQDLHQALFCRGQQAARPPASRSNPLLPQLSPNPVFLFPD